MQSIQHSLLSFFHTYPITALLLLGIMLVWFFIYFSPDKRRRRRRSSRNALIPEKVTKPAPRKPDEDIKIQKNKKNEVEKLNNLDTPDTKIVGLGQAVGKWTRYVLNQKAQTLSEQREFADQAQAQEKGSKGFWTMFLGLTGGTEKGKSYFRDLVKKSKSKDRGGPGL